MLMFGGGIKKGYVYGKTADERPCKTIEKPIRIEQIHQTIYRALGIPVDMFTVMFAIGRLPGWIAQWKEMRINKEPIGRPRQVYTGYTLRPFKEVKDR